MPPAAAWTRDHHVAYGRWTTAITAVVLTVFIVVVGTPAWWTSTDIYRAPLPYNRMRTLGHATTVMPIDIWVRTDDNAFAGVVDLVQQELNRTTVIHSGTCGVEVQYTVTARGPAPMDPAGIPDSGRVYGFTIDRQAEAGTGDETTTIHVGDSRLFRVVPGQGDSVWRTATDMAAFVSDVVVDRATLAAEAQKASVGKRGPSTGKDTNVEREMTVPINANYAIDLTLVVANPETTPATWDVGPAVSRYLGPLFQRLDFLGEFVTTSQVLYYVKPGVTPITADDGEGQVLRESQLTEFVNNDWPLSSTVGSILTTPLNFIAYVPPHAGTPLYILDHSGDRIATNGFTIPQWGGVHIVNAPRPHKENPELPSTIVHEVDMRHSMSIVVTQLRTLFGLSGNVSGPHKVGNARIVYGPSAHGQGVSLWEMDLVLRRRLVELVATSTSTLADLSNLLGEVEKMAIRDEIAVQVHECLDSLDRALVAVQSPAPDSYRSAYAAARSAVISSETAFFDPTIVKLLYFPDENKYALYVPLFVPLFVTVFALLRAEKDNIRALLRRASA